MGCGAHSKCLTPFANAGGRFTPDQLMITRTVVSMPVPETLSSKSRIAVYSKTNRLRCAGFTLLETMVSFVILGVGLLGIAALQGNALRYNNQAYLRSQAVIVAYDIFERMRANPVGVAGGHYVYGAAESDDALTEFGERQGTNIDCTLRSCTPRQLAVFDMAKWSQSISGLLPSGSGSLGTTGENEYTVTIYWMEQQNTSPADEDTPSSGDHSLVISVTM
jgi:type IV pilus assembly protein PilV